MSNAVYERSLPDTALRQGALISGLLHPYTTAESIADSEKLVVKHLEYPLAIIVSQDCDLDLEFNSRRGIPNESGNVPLRIKQITNILFCNVYLYIDARADLGIDASTWRSLKSNSNERYQYLREVSAIEDANQEGYAALVIDFKRHFSLMTDEAYAQVGKSAHRRCRLMSPYMEHLCSRFTRYISRVALPYAHEL